MWKRHSPETFLGQTRQEKQQIALDNSPSIVKSVVYASMKYKSQDSQDAQYQAAKTEAIIASNPNMSEADKAAVTEMMRSRVSMSFGTRAESKTATKVEIEENIVLIADSKTYKYDLCQVENTQFIISGKVDRVEEVGGELYLVEIKNRMNRLFLEVPGAVPFSLHMSLFHLSTFILIPLHSSLSLYFPHAQADFLHPTFLRSHLSTLYTPIRIRKYSSTNVSTNAPSKRAKGKIDRTISDRNQHYVDITR